MDDSQLRSSLIRLAHAHPELRSELLPLIREANQKTARTATVACYNCGASKTGEALAQYLLKFPRGWGAELKGNGDQLGEIYCDECLENPDGKTAGVLDDNDNPFGLYPGHEAVTEAIDAEITATAVQVASAYKAIERLINANAKLGANDTDSRQRIWTAWFTAIKAAMQGRT